jgi:hypothetical protein
MGAIAAGLPGCCGNVVKQMMLLLLCRGVVAAPAAAAAAPAVLLLAAAAMLLPATPVPANVSNLQLPSCNRSKQNTAASDRVGRLLEVMQQAWIGRCKSMQSMLKAALFCCYKVDLKLVQQLELARDQPRRLGSVTSLRG